VTPDTPQPVPGFDSAETFSNRRQSDFFDRMIGITVMMVAGTWLTLGLVMMLLGLGGLGWLLALVLALTLGALLYRREEKRELMATWSGSTLQLSPFGAVAFDQYVRFELPWSGLHKVTRATFIDPEKMLSQINHPGDMAVVVPAVLALREERLIGEGSLSVSPKAPAWVRRRIKRSYETWRKRGIMLTHFDPHWRTGRIGQWVHAYRPDLMA
jgi:hypothetical protein